MESVILYRNHAGGVAYLADEDGEMLVFPDPDAAIEAANSHPLMEACLWQLVELDEL